MTTRIEVDFNTRDDHGFVAALLADADGPVRVGDEVQAYDEEGYRCLAIVTAVAASHVSLDPLWQAFAAPGESRLVIAPAPGVWVDWKNGLTVALRAPTAFRVNAPTTAPQPTDPTGRFVPA